jgi:hypothetical protein
VNTSRGERRVPERFMSYGPDQDWFTLTFQDQVGAVRTLAPAPLATEGKVELQRLDPGVELTKLVELAEWARQPAGGGAPLAPGAYQVRAMYEVPPGAGHWSGRLEAGPLMLTLGN